MANKDYGPKDYGGATSLTSLLAAKGITAKPGVSSGGNTANVRAQQFAAGKVYTPAKSTNLVANKPQMQTNVGAGGRVSLAPMGGPQSRGFPNSAPPTSINAPMRPMGGGSPMQSRGAPAQPSYNPLSSASSGLGGLGSYIQQNGPDNFMGLGGGAQPKFGPDAGLAPMANAWAQGFNDDNPGRRWGGLGQAPRTEIPAWLPSLFSIFAQMTGGK